MDLWHIFLERILVACRVSASVFANFGCGLYSSWKLSELFPTIILSAARILTFLCITVCVDHDSASGLRAGLAAPTQRGECMQCPCT